MKRVSVIAAFAASQLILSACDRQRSEPTEEAPVDVASEEDVEQSLHGTIVVGEDFSPVSVEGSTGGAVRAATFQSGCKGNVTAIPGHLLNVTETSELTIAARPSTTRMADLTLVVRMPDGSWQCVDDAEELNPVLEIEATPGVYSVWVGAYSDRLNERYELSVSPGEADLGETAPEGPEPEPLDMGRFGGLRIVPDTGHASLNGTAGGTRNATDIAPGCSGFIAMNPDHILELTGETELFLRVQSRKDTTLLLQGPGETTHCNDDTDGWNPALRETLSPGVWSVYVGTYAPSEFPEYQLHVSR